MTSPRTMMTPSTCAGARGTSVMAGAFRISRTWPISTAYSSPPSTNVSHSRRASAISGAAREGAATRTGRLGATSSSRQKKSSRGSSSTGAREPRTAGGASTFVTTRAASSSRSASSMRCTRSGASSPAGGVASRSRVCARSFAFCLMRRKSIASASLPRRAPSAEPGVELGYRRLDHIGVDLLHVARERLEERARRELVHDARDAAAPRVQERDRVGGEERRGAPGDVEPVAQVPARLLHVERPEVVGDADPLRERLAALLRQPLAQLGLAEEHDPDERAVVGREVGEEAQLVVRAAACQELRLVHHHDGEDAARVELAEELGE